MKSLFSPITMLLGHVPSRLPYDFGRLLALLRRYPHPTILRVHGDTLRRVIRVSGAHVLIEVEADGDLLGVRALASDGDFDRASALTQVVHILNLDSKRDALQTALESHPALRAALAPVIGLPLLRAIDLFEPLACAVIEQQISWRAALKAQHWLMGWAGEGVSYAGEWWTAFPSSTRMAAASHEALLPLKITHKRIDLLRSLAQAVSDGAFDLTTLTGMDEAGRMRALTAIKGIGSWTAAVALSRAYGAGFSVPVNDVALQAAAYFYLTGRDGRFSADELGEKLGVLGDWAGTAAELLLCRWVLERY